MVPHRVEKARSVARLDIPRLLALPLSLGALLAFCTADTQPANAGQHAGARVPLTIGVTGCSVLRAGHVCELSGEGARELTFWFPDAQVGEQPTTILGGRDVECSPGKRLEGEGGNTDAGVVVSCRMQSDATSGQLQLELKGRINTLLLEVAPRWHWQDELARLANPGAIERLNALLPKTKDAERGRVLSALAVRQTAVGDWRAACDTLEQAATIAAGLGRHSESRHRWLVCAYQASEHYDFELARRAIAQAAEHPGGDEAIVDVEREAFVDYAWSFFHTKLGEYDHAEAAYARTIAWSQRGAAGPQTRPAARSGLPLPS